MLAPQDQSTAAVYAGLPRRIAATLIDAHLMLFAVWGIYFVMARIQAPLPREWFREVWIDLFLAYDITMLWCYGWTLGKRALDVKVVGLRRDRLAFFQTLLRETVGKSLSSLLLLGFLWIGIDSKHQGWHDKLARTYVVRIAQ